VAGEPDTKKLVRPVRREAHRNLVWKQTKALCIHPIAGKCAIEARLRLLQECNPLVSMWLKQRLTLRRKAAEDNSMPLGAPKEASDLLSRESVTSLRRSE
jgi:hypothetical protein